MKAQPTNFALTARDREILETLTLRIRVLSVAQIGRVWWRDSASPVSIVRRRLKQLQEAGYVEPLNLMAHPELPLTEPIVNWRPGDPAPDFGAVSWRLRSRWTQPLVNTTCAIATRSAGQFFGGYGGRKPRRAETTHDLHLSAIFLRMRTLEPSRAATWISEADRKKDSGYGEKLPDGIVIDGQQKTAIEFGGAYDKPKLQEFHAFCDQQALAYEIW